MLSQRAASEPGRLRLRLELQKATAMPDGAGGSALAWNTVATIAADMQPVRAGERDVGEGLGDLTLQRVVIRHRSDVAAGDRYRLGARLFRVVSVSDPAKDGRFLVCPAEEEGRL